VFCFVPISRDGNIQLDEGLSQDYGQVVIGDHPLD
jgi:hypothetical protein